MKTNRLLFFLATLTIAPFGLAADDSDVPGWTEVAAIFNERCVMCHSAIAGASKGLRLDEYSAALVGSERGAVLIAGNVAGSELIRRLRGESLPRMPFLSRPLRDTQINLIERWVEAGMPMTGQTE